MTGARQVGKTTLAGEAFPDHHLVNFDAPAERAVYESLTPADWIARYPRAIIDEAQKLPSIFDTIKACYDRDPEVRYVLLGSSRILLMKSVGETLAGRAALTELFPFSLAELTTPAGEAPRESRFSQLLGASDPEARFRELFPPHLALEDETARARMMWERFLDRGAMPPIAASDWSEEDCLEWLRDYQSTYLQRDLADLSRLDRLEPFVRAQRAVALRVGQPLSFAEIARLAGISPPTASQFVRSLEISYQVSSLPAWFRNESKRLTKRPKLVFLDPPACSGSSRAHAASPRAPNTRAPWPPRRRSRSAWPASPSSSSTSAPPTAARSTCCSNATTATSPSSPSAPSTPTPWISKT